MPARQTAFSASNIVAMSGVYYHGSEANFVTFDPSRTKSGVGLWLTHRHPVAQAYANKFSNGQVLKFKFDLKKVAQYNIALHAAHRYDPYVWRDFFKSQGCDGIGLVNENDIYVIVFDPKDAIRLP